MSTESRTKFTAVVTGKASQEFSKSNGGAYVLQNCEIKDGPLAGLVVSGTRTIKNADGATKEPIEVGSEVVLYLSQIPSTQDPTKMKNFFEISTGASASDEEINARLAQAMAGANSNALAEQAV